MSSDEPIGWHLYDDDSAPALAIDDGATRRTLHLEWRNLSAQPLELVALDAPRASAEHHHVELRFRPGTLSRHTRQALAREDGARAVLGAAIADWDLAIEPTDWSTEGVPVSIYLLRRGGDRLDADERQTISLHEFRAAAGSASRPTQVQLRLRYARAQAPKVRIDSLAHRHLYLLHWGRSDVPLRVGFPGGNVLCNDGREQSLSIVLCNTSIDSTVSGAADAARQARLELQFEFGGAAAPWALARPEASQSITLGRVSWLAANGAPLHSGPASTMDAVDTEHGLGPQRGLTLALPPNGLPPGGRLEIELRGIRTEGQGPTVLVIAYRNLQGYRNGHIVCELQRSDVKAQLEKVRNAVRNEVRAEFSEALQRERGGAGQTLRATQMQIDNLTKALVQDRTQAKQGLDQLQSLSTALAQARDEWRRENTLARCPVAIALLSPSGLAISRPGDFLPFGELVWVGEDRRFQFGGVLQLTGTPRQLAGAVIMIVKLPLAAGGTSESTIPSLHNKVFRFQGSIVDGREPATGPRGLAHFDLTLPDGQFRLVNVDPELRAGSGVWDLDLSLLRTRT